MKNIFKIIIALTLIFSVYNCTSASEEDLLEPIVEVTFTTYNDNVKSIIDTNCVGCHNSGTNPAGPFPLETFAEVKDKFMNGNGIARTNLPDGTGGIMPPAGKMNSSLLTIINNWKNDGFLEN